jgi:dTDP-4-dehydrorhamnose 3,5-epimerase
MKFNPAPIPGVFTIDLQPIADERGFFSRVFCTEEFKAHGLEPVVMQMNNSFNRDQGTLRGLHYQLAPAAEVKIVRCVAGALWDVVLDMREGSPTFGQYFGADLTAENRRMMYIPRGFAHGIFTLAPNTEAIYLVSHPYTPAAERGVRWNDPKFAIRWPGKPVVISEKDQKHPDFDPAIHLR